MHWTIEANVSAIVAAMQLAHTQRAKICAFSELALTGFHREIAAQAKPELVAPALARVQEICARLKLAVALGAPTFGAQGSIYNSHLLIDELGALVATVSKCGLTAPEATFFSPGTERPVATLQGLRCSAIICREISDLGPIAEQLPAGSTHVIFLPGALRQDPAKPVTEPPEYIADAQAMARATRSTIVQTNWPNALNRPEESVDGGHSAVISPSGELLFRLPRQQSGIGIFTLGERSFDWHAQ